MKCTFPAKDKDLLKIKHGVGNIARNMLALNCMLGKNKSKTLYNCNCLSVVVNVFVKDSQLFMIIDRHAYYYFVFPNPGDICLKGKLCFKSLPDIQLPNFILHHV